MVIGDILAHMVLGLFGMFIDIVFAKVVFQLHTPDIAYLLSFVGQYIIALIVCMLIGALLAFIVINPEVVMPLGLLIMFAMYMLCGAFITFTQLPAALQHIADLLPFKYAMNDFYTIWSGQSLLISKFIKLSLLYGIVSAILLCIAVKLRLKSSKHRTFD